jgi:hypothetical protein
MGREAPGRKLTRKGFSKSQAGSPLNEYHGMESIFLRGIAVKSRIREKSRSGAQCQPCASWIKAIDASLPGGMGRAVEPGPSLMQGKRQVVQGS